jgi:hypothetical protein
MSSDGASFKWKQRHWNTGEYEPECDNRALDIYHPQPEGLKKPQPQPVFKCLNCGHIRCYGADHFTTKYPNGGFCETWLKSGHDWFLFDRTEW